MPPIDNAPCLAGRIFSGLEVTATARPSLKGGPLRPAEHQSTARSSSVASAGDHGVLVVVAPDKFKGSLSAPEVARAVTRGIRRQVPSARIVEHPIADGGEGTVDMVLRQGFRPVSCEVSGPLETPVLATYAMRGDTAVIEMASAAGLALIPGRPDDRSAGTASTYGVGQLIHDALDRGAERIVLGVGGSATTDGGAGMIAALGGRLLTAAGPVVPAGGQSLLAVDQLDLAQLDGRLAATSVVVACDVDNPLTGPQGAAAVYGRQKGATAAMARLLDRGLARWADAVTAATASDRRALPGAGAAGGLGFGAAAVIGAEIRPGIDYLLEISGFRAAIAGADLVIVGEGSLDEQSLRGKGPVGVAAAAARAGVRSVAVAGRSTVSVQQAREHGISTIYTLVELEPDTGRSMRLAAGLLESVAGRIAADWLGGGAAELGANVARRPC